MNVVPRAVLITGCSTGIGRVAAEERDRWVTFDANHPRNVTASFTELEWE